MIRSSTVPIAFGLVLAVLNHPTSAMYAFLAAIYLEVIGGGGPDDD